MNDVITQKSFAPLAAGQDHWLLENPDRGFRTETVWYVKDMAEMPDVRAALTDKLDVYLKGCLPEKIKLDMVYIYLTQYRDMDIPPEGMDAMRIFFDICRQRRIKLMVRFSYCDSFMNLPTGANEETMMRHIKQLAPLVAENADVIHTIQCGFVGSYGEWASVYQQPPVNYRNVIRAIVENLTIPNGLFYQIRLPEYKNEVSDLPELYNRIGFNNDAFFGEQQLYGWESGDFQLGHPNGQWEQIIREAAWTPQDGELFVNVNLVQTRRMVDGIEAILELAHHRHTSLSCWHGYKEISSDWEHTTVMGRWKTQPITGEMLQKHNVVYCPGWFYNKNGEKIERSTFQFVRDHLGYKLEAQDLEVTGDLRPGQTVHVKMNLKNYGFSAAFNLESGFAILDSDYRPVSAVRSGDPAAWHSHSPYDYQDTHVPTHTLKCGLTVPKAAGNYKIAFYLKNTMGDCARLGNQIDYISGYNILHEFSI